MTLTFHSIETEQDRTLVVFKKEGAILSAGNAFSDAAKPELLQTYEADALVEGRYDRNSLSEVQRGAALDALILHRVENDAQYDEGTHERELSDHEVELLQKGRIVEAMNLKM